MAYTQDLIDEVKELYPDSKEMIAHAESGSVWLGRYLDDSVPYGMPWEEIINATSLYDLQGKARLAKRKLTLYKKWCEQDPRKQQPTL